MDIQQNKKEVSDYFEDIAFHPSLDIKHDILVLGFRVKPELNKEENIFLIVSKGIPQVIKDGCFSVDENTYQIDVKGKKLAILSRQWSRSELKAFLKTLESVESQVKPSETFCKLKEELKKYVELDDVDYTIVSSWIIGTYFFPLFPAYSYLHIKAPKSSGKTQCLSFLNQTCFNATKARASLPAMRDTVDALRGTYLMDQADALHRPNMEDFLDILTDSYKRGGGNVRKMIASDKGKNWGLEEFQAYGPKGFASIKDLPEDLRDRCIIIALTRSGRNFNPLNEEDTSWKELRGELYKLLITSFQEVALQFDFKSIEYRHNPAIVGRQLELWLPLEVIMGLCGVSAEEQETARKRFLSQYGFAEAQITEIEREVIEKIREAIGDRAEVVLAPSEIAGKIDSFIFEDMSSNKQQSAEVGKIINKFNLSTEKLPRSNKTTRYVFTKEKIEKIYSGYFTQESVPEHTPAYTGENELENLDDLPVDEWGV